MKKAVLFSFFLGVFTIKLFAQIKWGKTFDRITANVGLVFIIGNCNVGGGFNFSFEEKMGDFKIAGGGSITGFALFSKTGREGLELRGSLLGGFDDGNIGLCLGTNIFRGLGGMSTFRQRTGILQIKIEKFYAFYENDGSPFPKIGLSDGYDSYRTAAVRIGYGNFSAGFNLFTGLRQDYSLDAQEMASGTQYGIFGERMPNGYVQEVGFPYRLGVIYLAYKEIKAGLSSDRWGRHGIQDIFAHNILSPQPGFHSLKKNIQPFYEVANSPSPIRFTLHD